MQLKRTVGVFASGCVVYAAMAACSSTVTVGKTGATVSGTGGHSAGVGGHGGMTAMVGSGGNGGQEGGGGDSGIFDALLDPVPTADASPGSRLKGKYLLGDDGTKEYLYVPGIASNQGPPGNSPNLPTSAVHQLWYDSMRQEDCTFARASDGKLRCLPTNAIDWYDQLYADAQCTHGVAVFVQPNATCTPSYTPPTYVIATTNPAMPMDCIETATSTKRVFLLGQPLPAPMGSFWWMLNGTCTAYGLSGWPGFVNYKVGAEVPADSFVGATPMIDP